MITRVAAEILQRLASTALFSTSRSVPLHVMASVGPVEAAIKKKLEDALHPTYIEIINESSMHNVPSGSETHFKVLVVSEVFNDLSLIKRHRLVNTALSEELQAGVHALSIIAQTPAQWEREPREIEPSPTCRGGFGK